MKKKLSLLFISLLLCFGYVNAESMEDKVSISSGGNELVGYHWVQSYTKKSTSINHDFSKSATYKGLASAQAACKRLTGSSDPNACVYSPTVQKYTCKLDGADNMVPQACREHLAHGKACKVQSKGNYLCELSGVTKSGSGRGVQNNCNEYCKKYTRSCNGSCAQDQKNTVYKVGVVKKTTTGGNYVEKVEESHIWNYILKSSSGTTDNAYCLQPGKKGPGGEQYCLNKQIDLNDCDDSLQKHYYCGLAQMLFYTMTPQTDANGKTTFVDSGEYGFGSITTALRMWVAYYGSVKGGGIGGVNEIGLENDRFEYYTNTPVYLNTAKAAASGYNGSPCATTKSNNNMGVLCGDVMDKDHYNQSYTRSIALFQKVLAMFNGGGGKFLDGLLGGSNDDDFKIEAKDNNGNPHLNAPWPKSFTEETTTTTTQNTYKIECSADELFSKDSKCRMYVQAYYLDANGKKVYVPKNEMNGSCSKEKCEVEVKGDKTCTDTTTSSTTSRKYTFEVTLKGYNSVGLIREYRHCANPNDYQIMFTAVFNKEKVEKKDEKSGSDKTFTASVFTTCECDDEKRCSDFRPVSKTLGGDASSASCGNNYDSYDKFDKADPYMNCILNPCNDSDKLMFRRDPGELGLNQNVCDVYCRKEVLFFLANKKKVYAGMQFRYDIGPVVLECESSVDDIVKKDAALTSIVLQKKQCTSEIYYDQKNKYGNKKTWLEQYDEAVKAMMKAYTNWKKYESVYDWQMKDNGGKPQTITASAKPCAYGSNSCGSTSCRTPITLPAINYVYGWPTQGYNDGGPCGSWGGLSTTPYIGWKASTGETKGKNFNVGSQGGSYGTTSGTFNCGSNSCPSFQCYCGDCGVDKDGKPKGGCCPSKHETTDGTCNAGSGGNASKAKNDNDNAYEAYTKTVDAVAQLLYDLQNCNMYVASGNTAPTIQDYYTAAKVPSKYNGSHEANITRSASGSAKNIILQESVCDEANKECADMSLEYDDELYGKNVTIEKETKNLESEELNKTYFCKNNDDSDPDCYKYVKNKEVELKKGNKLEAHDLVFCNAGARNDTKCWTEQKQLPTNDYATFIIVTETDFWRSDKFTASAYTGLVGDGGGDGLSTPLGNEEYPVSNGLNTGGKTGTYGVKQHIDNVKITVDDNVSLDYSCTYDVYNTTNLYDCATKTADGKLDTSKCKNSCYQVIAGVPVIKPECSEFELKDNDSKGYGFVYRNVDLNNLFPNETKRPIGINWGSNLGQETTAKIEQKGSDLFVYDENISYSFVLSPTAINRIREYNTQQEVMGVGYQDLSYISCEQITDTINQSGLKGFYKCRSKFLEEISQPNNSYDVYTKKFSNPGEGVN